MKTIEELEAELETVTRERDLSLFAWESAGMQGRDAKSAMLELARQLEEARAIVGSCWLTYSEGERDKARAWAHKCERERDEARDTIVALTTAKAEADLEIATLTTALDERDVEAERSLEQYDRLVRERDRLREQVVTVNNNIETFQKETWRYRHERDEALAEIAEWKRVTGYDDTETLDFECGRAGIRTHIDVCSRLRETANRERDEARAEAERLREECRLRKAERDQVERNGFAATKGLVDESERLRAKALAYDLAYRRGAEAMREACANCVKHLSHEDGLGMGSQRIEGAIRALPIPEEP
jgi:chromosome segregation ATPase